MARCSRHHHENLNRNLLLDARIDLVPWMITTSEDGPHTLPWSLKMVSAYKEKVTFRENLTNIYPITTQESGVSRGRGASAS